MKKEIVQGEVLLSIFFSYIYIEENLDFFFFLEFLLCNSFRTFPMFIMCSCRNEDDRVMRVISYWDCHLRAASAASISSEFRPRA